MNTYTLKGHDFTEMCCGECGVTFYVPDFFQQERQKTGKGWYCPNGHSRVYRESDADKFRRERDQLRQQNARLAQERADALAVADKATASLQRHKKRAAAGTCPCCKRTFKALQAHMTNKHPDWVKDANVIPMKAGAK